MFFFALYFAYNSWFEFRGIRVSRVAIYLRFEASPLYSSEFDLQDQKRTSETHLHKKRAVGHKFIAICLSSFIDRSLFTSLASRSYHIF